MSVLVYTNPDDRVELVAHGEAIVERVQTVVSQPLLIWPEVSEWPLLCLNVFQIPSPSYVLISAPAEDIDGHLVDLRTICVLKRAGEDASGPALVETDVSFDPPAMGLRFEPEALATIRVRSTADRNAIWATFIAQEDVLVLGMSWHPADAEAAEAIRSSPFLIAKWGTSRRPLLELFPERIPKERRSKAHILALRVDWDPPCLVVCYAESKRALNGLLGSREG